MSQESSQGAVARRLGLVGIGAGVAVLATVVALSVTPSAPEQPQQEAAIASPVPLAPVSAIGDEIRFAGTWNPRPVHPIEEIGAEGVVTTGIVEPTIIDTRTFPVQIQHEGPRQALYTGAASFLPPHNKPKVELFDGVLARSTPPTGGLRSDQIVELGRGWTAIEQTPWTPPDPTIAVGPDHVVVTVNMDIAFYTKDGQLQFFAPLNDSGNPGFFEEVGAKGFTFDPKCFYDHEAGRFVVLALEVYGTSTPTQSDDEATLTFAVSATSDPNGIWYKYRTNAIVTVGSDTFWWDYPGFGYDSDAYYVTGNLFGLNNGGFGGTGFRIFDKAPLLTGSPATFSTLRSTDVVSTQVAHHYGDNSTPYFVSVAFLDAWRIAAIQDPLTNPTLQIATIATPPISPPPGAPSPGGTVDTIDVRAFNVHWRNNKLYAGHNIRLGPSRAGARWMQFDMGDWPNSGSPTLEQVGVIDLGGSISTFEPAIFADTDDNVGVVFASSSSTENVKMWIAARKPSDPPGTLADPIEITQGSTGSNGRWGDYYDITIDPTDGRTFWAIGQTSEPFGWSTFVQEFGVEPAPSCLGDVNGDNIVDLDDFAILALNFGAGPAATAAQGDLNGDGFVNLDDFAILALNFGNDCN